MSAAPPWRVGNGARIAIALVAVALVIGAIVLLPRIAGPIAGPALGYGAGASVTIASTWTDPGQAPARLDLIISVDRAFSSWRGMVRRQQPQP